MDRLLTEIVSVGGLSKELIYIITPADSLTTTCYIDPLFEALSNLYYSSVSFHFETQTQVDKW